MKESYSNLNDLLSHDSSAKEFYLRQPEDVQGRMQQNSQSICSVEHMRRCAQTTRGDE